MMDKDAETRKIYCENCVYVQRISQVQKWCANKIGAGRQNEDAHCPYYIRLHKNNKEGGG